VVVCRFRPIAPALGRSSRLGRRADRLPDHRLQATYDSRAVLVTESQRAGELKEFGCGVGYWKRQSCRLSGQFRCLVNVLMCKRQPKLDFIEGAGEDLWRHPLKYRTIRVRCRQHFEKGLEIETGCSGKRQPLSDAGNFDPSDHVLDQLCAVARPNLTKVIHVVTEA
jgi:hypothetical protein